MRRHRVDPLPGVARYAAEYLINRWPDWDAATARGLRPERVDVAAEIIRALNDGGFVIGVERSDYDRGSCESHDCKELTCCWCREPYSAWAADNNLWSAVMRLPDGSDRAQFLCPRCFLIYAEPFIPVARITVPEAKQKGKR